MKRGRESSKSQYEGFADALELILDPIRGKLGIDYNAELIISTKGNYIYHCKCNATSFGSLQNIDMKNPCLPCLECNVSFKIDDIINTPIHNPRFYKLKFYKTEEGIEKVAGISSEYLEGILAIVLHLKQTKDGWKPTD